MRHFRCLGLIAACCALLQVAAAVPFPLPPPHQPVKAAAEPVQHEPTDGAEAFFSKCPQGPDWIKYKDSCYRYNETFQYWYLAEQDCRGYRGHLVSIRDQAENQFVAKLTYCQSAWTGRYSVNADRLRDPANYRWTDGGSGVGGYHAHNFSSISSVHEPLISSSNLLWFNRVYHSKDRYVCKVPVGDGGNSSGPCPAGWRWLNGFCYQMPSFPATYIEATFYCSGRGAYLVSIYTQQELRALSLLDPETGGCPPQVWVGLIKVNPCRIDMFTGQPICYKWADRINDFHNGFPSWHQGHPNTGPQINCVLLQDRAMKTVECQDRHRFVCKKQA